MSEFNITVITNITLEPYFSKHLCALFTDNIRIEYILFDEYRNPENYKNFCEADVIIIWINLNAYCSDFLESIYKDGWCSLYNFLLDSLTELYKSVYKINENIVWVGLEDYYLKNYIFTGARLTEERIANRLNDALINKFGENIYLLDIKYLIAKVGIDSSYDNKNMYRWNSPYSSTFMYELSKEIYKWSLVINNVVKKCIVVDCDNVLWKGTLAEDGIANVVLGDNGIGKSYKDFQRYLLYLHHHGIILTVASKNDEVDVIKMFREHGEMAIKEDNIACFYVNWNSKVDNIKSIASYLNIGLNSIVFIDDSKNEIDTVKNLLPEVLTIEFKPDTVYRDLDCINVKAYVDDKIIESRIATYKTNAMREMLKRDSDDIEDYLEKLETKIIINVARDTDINRIAELTQRTNRCTNGKRYNVVELNAKINEESYILYSVSVKDKFSDLGLVGAIGIKNNILDLFALSCRALGRKVEDKMYKLVLEAGIREIICYDTKKNERTICDLKSLITKKL